MKYLVMVVLAFASSNVYASDNWDSCSSADGTVKMDNGVLSIDGVGEIVSESVELKVLSTVKNEKEMCELKGSKQNVIAYVNTVTVEQVTYNVEENDSPSTVILLCERGGSGIPANDECK